MQTDFRADRDLINRAVQSQPLAPAHAPVRKKREGRKAWREARDRAWTKLKVEYANRHPEAGLRVGILSPPSWYLWWQIFSLLWPVFMKAWNAWHGDEDGNIVEPTPDEPSVGQPFGFP